MIRSGPNLKILSWTNYCLHLFVVSVLLLPLKENSSLFRNSIVSVGDDSHGVVKKLHIFLTQQSFKA